MVDAAEAQRSDAEGQGGASSGAEGQRRPSKRRQGSKLHNAFYDELAQETQRLNLLNAVEAQVRSKTLRSRILLGCSISDNKDVHLKVEKEFEDWVRMAEAAAIKAEEEGAAISSTPLAGLLIFQPVQLLHFLEGTTDQLLAALKAFHSLSIEVTATDNGPPARPALISNLRILYFTEAHGVQTMNGWTSVKHETAKSMGGPAMLQDMEACSMAVFGAYRKLMMVNCKITQATGGGGGSSAVQNAFRQSQDLLPTLDEVTSLLHKNTAEFFFTFAEFEKSFAAPFHMVLQSELLWPMPPPLSY